MSNKPGTATRHLARCWPARIQRVGSRRCWTSPEEREFILNGSKVQSCPVCGPPPLPYASSECRARGFTLRGQPCGFAVWQDTGAAGDQRALADLCERKANSCPDGEAIGHAPRDHRFVTYQPTQPFGQLGAADVLNRSLLTAVASRQACHPVKPSQHVGKQVARSVVELATSGVRASSSTTSLGVT